MRILFSSGTPDLSPALGGLVHVALIGHVRLRRALITMRLTWPDLSRHQILGCVWGGGSIELRIPAATFAAIWSAIVWLALLTAIFKNIWAEPLSPIWRQLSAKLTNATKKCPGSTSAVLVSSDMISPVKPDEETILIKSVMRRMSRTKRRFGSCSVAISASMFLRLVSSRSRGPNRVHAASRPYSISPRTSLRAPDIAA